LTDAVATLVQAAGAAASQGRWGEAERLWRQVLAREPRHQQALYSLGVHAFKAGKLPEALQLLQVAQAGSPGDPVVALSLSVVRRELGDAAGELAAIEAALTGDPYFLPALLAKAAHLERLGRVRAAATIYRNALQVAGPEPRWPPPLREQLLHAREVVDRVGRELTAFLAERVGTRVDALTPVEAQRWREAGAIMAGTSAPYHPVCSQLHVPRVPAHPFYEREQFEWVEALEGQTRAIGDELAGLLAEGGGGFAPYVAYEPGVPVNQWHELNHSRRWTSYFLWRNGTPVAEHQQRCPATTAALDAVEKADIGGLCPNAMFSALAPHTHIPPHHGETNARLVVHLPLIVPDHCRYRVGFEHRHWTVGEVLIFDDSIEHEARNDSDELRVVLIFDVWNPLLSPAERDMVRALSAAMREFQVRA
jgi:aspartyl/asparaginyl beta-hydroxylase (cupin superfamily)